MHKLLYEKRFLIDIAYYRSCLIKILIIAKHVIAFLYHFLILFIRAKSILNFSKAIFSYFNQNYCKHQSANYMLNACVN